MKLETSSTSSSSSLVQLLQSPQLGQIVLLLFSLSCCGSLVGLSRLLPRLASETFHTTSQSLILYFVAIFGLSKATFNLVSAQWASSHSRVHILAVGWLMSLVAPLLILRAGAWSTVLWSTLFFGAAQGVLTSTSVIMLMDRVGSRQRGLVNGVLECTIYCSLALFTLISGRIEEALGYRPYIPYLSLAVSVSGLLSTAVIADTRALVRAEELRLSAPVAPTDGSDDINPLLSLPSSSSNSPGLHPIEMPLDQQPGTPPSSPPESADLSTTAALLRCWQRPHLLALIFAGYTNNLDDGVIWGSLPAFFAQQGIPVHLITVLLTTYPLVWGLLQVLTGMMADRSGRKGMIVGGMWCQSASFLLMFLTAQYVQRVAPASAITATSLPFLAHALAAVVLGIGTALCYPVLQASLSDSVPPKHRASTLGVYRLCRDSGYVAGGLLSGVVADWLSLNTLVLGLSAMLMCAAMYGQLRITDRNRK